MPSLLPRIEAEFLENTETFTTVLLAIVLNEYGTECLSWAPETIFLELEDDFRITVPLINKTKIVVGINLMTSDDFFKRPPRFVQICNVLSGSILRPEFDKADCTECAWGLTEALLICPPESEDPEPFCDGIRHYLGHILKEEGITNPPDVLQLALQDSKWMIGSHPPDWEDPASFAHEYGVNHDRSGQIMDMLREGIQDLSDQLELLPFVQESGGDVLQRMRTSLQN